mmetsp:Transcript_19988/g.30278  ORF Transcript_19988/g.30278 Transcript_19988/m.30278 type:complete len:85 (-) Transcript_19988:1932-2186(-)
MVTKSIVIMDGEQRRKSWMVGNQAALESLLRRYKVDVLLEESSYNCEITQHASLAEGGKYRLGDSFSSSVELREYRNNNKTANS